MSSYTEGSAYDNDGERCSSNDNDAIRRLQPLRFEGDLYTPRLVRFSGTQKQGLCEICRLLVNGFNSRPLRSGVFVFWMNMYYLWNYIGFAKIRYHKQFFHGISSTTGQYFIHPSQMRLLYQQVGTTSDVEHSPMSPTLQAGCYIHDRGFLRTLQPLDKY